MTDISGVLQGLDRFLAAQQRGLNEGLEDGAMLLQLVASETDAYAGMSGATRASTVAYPFGPNVPPSQAFEQAYQTAAQLLDGYTGHDGKPARMDADVPAGATGIVLTVPTDYVDDLEFDLGGQKAFLAPTLRQEAQTVTANIARAMKAST